MVELHCRLHRRRNLFFIQKLWQYVLRKDTIRSYYHRQKGNHRQLQLNHLLKNHLWAAQPVAGEFATIHTWTLCGL